MSRTYIYDIHGNRIRNYRKVRWPDGVPSWYINSQVNRPSRYRNRLFCKKIKNGNDIDDFLKLLTPGNKPKRYWY